MSGHDDLAERLDAVSEDLADRAMAALRSAMTAARAGNDEERAARAAEEKRLTKARRSVEKAASLLRGGPADGND